MVVSRNNYLLYLYSLLSNRPIANMATISPKQGFSVGTVAKGWSLVYMLMRVRYLVVFSLWKQQKTFKKPVITLGLFICHLSLIYANIVN